MNANTDMSIIFRAVMALTNNENRRISLNTHMSVSAFILEQMLVKHYDLSKDHNVTIFIDGAKAEIAFAPYVNKFVLTYTR